MNNKNETSFIEIVKSKMKGSRIKKDQLVVLLLFGVLLLVIALPMDGDSMSAAGILEEAGKDAGEEASGEKSSLQTDFSAVATGNLSYEEKLADDLEQFLRLVDGVGEVQVLIKVSGSSEQVVEKDIPATENVQSETDETGSTRSVMESQSEEATVYEETEDGRQKPYVIKEYAPEIEGVIIAAQGADQPVVAANILEAVQALLQLEVHKIKVLKMK